jgi:cytochrome c556
MSRLEAADERLGAAISSAGGFEKALEQLRHDAEIVAAIAEAIRQPDYEYHDDQSYLGHAAAMRDAAVRARDAVKKKDYEAARSAVGDLKKSCDSCHGDFRG